MDKPTKDQNMNRRSFFKGLGAAALGAAAASGKPVFPAASFGCASQRCLSPSRNPPNRGDLSAKGNPESSAGVSAGRERWRSSVDIKVNPAFAQCFVDYCEHPDPEIKNKLLAHPALGALVRHRLMTTGRRPERKHLLEQLLSSCAQASGARQVLAGWKNSRDEKRPSLFSAAAEALRYLPPKTKLAGTLFLVVNYDIGIPAPPDAALNVGHPHFVHNVDELAPYTTHEFHHVGFLAHRSFPGLDGMHCREKLQSLIDYFTQLEGMAVHAAFPIRRRHGWLENDEDYRVYTDPKFADKVISRYHQVCKQVRLHDTISQENAGKALTALSSGERLWYRMGALTSWSIEKNQGRKRLVDSIRRPGIFRQELDRLTDKNRNSPQTGLI